VANNPPHDKKPDLIDRILDIELEWFLNANPTITSECQRHPESFRLMRGSNFETWSEKTLKIYLEHLHEAQSQERNLMREKYAKMQKLIPCQNSSPTLNSNVAIQERWQQEAKDRYPGIFRQANETSFTWYLRSELDTYSPAVLESYLNDLNAASLEGKNLVIETYDRIAKKLGHSSLDEWHQKRG
jgi:hypothetical protein